MSAEPVDPIRRRRAASRELVRAWGFLSKGVEGSDLSAAAGHWVIGIGRGGGLTAAPLAERLRPGKSNASRLVRTLVARGEVAETGSCRDGRVKPLDPTSQGRRTLATPDATWHAQVTGALARLDPAARAHVDNGLRA